LEMKKI